MSHTCEPKTLHSTRHDAEFENPFLYMKVKGITIKSKDNTDDKVVTEYVIPKMKQGNPRLQRFLKLFSLFHSINLKYNIPRYFNYTLF